MFPSPDSQPAMVSGHRSEAADDSAVDRRLGKAALRLDQSRYGLQVAASASSDPVLQQNYRALANRRTEWRRILVDAALEQERPLGRRSDVLGAIHRRFVRLVARFGDAAVLNECDRGESALQRALQLAATRPDSRLTQLLSEWESEVEEDIGYIRASRKRKDRIPAGRQGSQRTGGISPGYRAPLFAAPASTGQTVDLASYAGKVPVVLLFTSRRVRLKEQQELEELQESLQDFAALRTQVMVITPVTAKQTRRIAERMGIAYPVVADPSAAIRKLYGFERNATPAGVLIDNRGVLVRSYRELNLPGFARRMRNTISKLQAKKVEGFDARS